MLALQSHLQPTVSSQRDTDSHPRPRGLIMKFLPALAVAVAAFVAGLVTMIAVNAGFQPRVSPIPTVLGLVGGAGAVLVTRALPGWQSSLAAAGALVLLILLGGRYAPDAGHVLPNPVMWAAVGGLTANALLRLAVGQRSEGYEGELDTVP
jgi:CDP-diglyceride synthetase